MNSYGNPEHKFSFEVCILTFIIYLYLKSFLSPWTFYQGSPPFAKYIIIYPIASKSSLRESSSPLCELIDAYLAVPVRDLPCL